jgi:hypothetical protein
MEKLLRCGFRDVSIHRCVSCRLMRAISLDNLAGDLVETAKYRGCRTMLAIDDGIESAFDRRNNHGCELRPIEILGNVLHI